jgi:hypothetical protein
VFELGCEGFVVLGRAAAGSCAPVVVREPLAEASSEEERARSPPDDAARGAVLRSAEAASSVKDVDEEPLEAAAPPVAPGLAGPEGGLTLSAGIEVPRRPALRELVGLALLFPVLCPQLFTLPALDDAVDHLGALGRVLPYGAIGVAFGAHPLHDFSLLLDCLGEAGEESLELAQARAPHTVRDSARKLARVVGFVVLELLKLGFALPDATLSRRESFCALPLPFVRDALRRP